MTLNLSLTFHGAARETTGSRHLLTLDDKRILLDCGLYQGRRKTTSERNLHFGFDPASVHSVILSHAHIDHSGNLPNLAKQGFGGSIHCTPATEDLCTVMLRDSAHIQEKDAEWLTRRSRKPGREPRTYEPLYTVEDAEHCMELFRSVHLHRRFKPLRDLEVIFLDAGHILGSAGIALDIRRGEDVHRLAFSGDIGRAVLPLLRPPEIPHGVEWLIMEGTYGARTHDPAGKAKEELRQAVERVVARGGKIIVPSFSVERTQEIVYFLNELHNEGRLPPIPVYVDSPLSTNVTEIYRLHPECFGRQARETLMHDEDIFGFERLTYVRDVEASKRLNTLRMPCVIIAASGMCEGGRIRHHLRNSIENPANCILFVGYQAQGTLGRKIVERQREVNIFGEPHRLRAEVVTLNTLSGHADKNGLFEYARTVKEAGALRKVFLVHGEENALGELGGRLREELGLDVVIPTLGETHALEA